MEEVVGIGGQEGRRGEVMNNNEDRGEYCSKGDDDGWEGQVGHGHAVGGGGGRHCEE